MCSAIQEIAQETTNLLVYKVWMGKRGGTGVFADLVLKRLWKAVVKTRLGDRSRAHQNKENKRRVIPSHLLHIYWDQSTYLDLS